MTRWRPALLVAPLAAATLGCGGEAAGARADSVATPAAPAAAAAATGAPPDSMALATAAPAGRPAPVAPSHDSLLKVAHRHPSMRVVPGALSEEAVQGVVDAINASDASIAAAAVSKASDAQVKRFASTLASAHSQKVTDTPPMQTAAGAIVAPLRDLQSTYTARLAGMSAGPSFDRAFLDAQIAAHERAVAVLDSIRPAAQTGDLPVLVASTRAEVVRHLDQARALQRRLPP